MIIVINMDGQTCNQLLYHSHVIATALETGSSVVFLCVDKKMRNSFSYNCKRIRIYAFDIKLMRYIANFLKRRRKFESYKEYSKRKKHDIMNRGIVILNNWLYRDYDAVWKWRNEIKEALAINCNVLNNYFKERLSIINRDGKIMVAIHARRGDYREWKNGNYYYDDETLLGWIKQLADSGNCLFLIFSNEKMEEEKFAGFDCIFPKGSVEEDLYLMSECDYIIGPPSTFSYWAAYIGGKKYLRVYNKNMQINFNCFDYVGVNEDDMD